MHLLLLPAGTHVLSVSRSLPVMSFRSKITFRRRNRDKSRRVRNDFNRLSVQEKPKLIDPLDYEAVICDLGDELKEDPLRELLLFPDNDFTVSTVPLERRTLQSTVPQGAELQAECLLVRQACEYYNSQLHVVHYKYEEYSGDYRLLPRDVRAVNRSLNPRETSHQSRDSLTSDPYPDHWNVLLVSPWVGYVKVL
ncbi:unnamed protein product [Coregonus sp. 'balchen']|nr:unnamed protein product [Coregonus sp. 'balchen']